MADVYVNALTTISTEPTTTDSLVAVNRNTNEGKIIDYNLLADAILNKLTSKQYSGLNTTSKLLVGAINELDSDVAALSGKTAIKSVSKYSADGTLTITVPDDNVKYYFFIFALNNTAPVFFMATINNSHEVVTLSDSTYTGTITNRTTITITGLRKYSSACILSQYDTFE